MNQSRVLAQLTHQTATHGVARQRWPANEVTRKRRRPAKDARRLSKQI